jgi:hypothetical protein
MLEVPGSIPVEVERKKDSGALFKEDKNDECSYLLSYRESNLGFS